MAVCSLLAPRWLGIRMGSILFSTASDRSFLPFSFLTQMHSMLACPHHKILTSCGVREIAAKLEWGKVGDESVLQLFKKPAPHSVQNRHGLWSICSVGDTMLVVTLRHSVLAAKETALDCAARCICLVSGWSYILQRPT